MAIDVAFDHEPEMNGLSDEDAKLRVSATEATAIRHI
jgi:hypothetical protein